MLLQKINVFTLHIVRTKMMRAISKETKSHFDFGLFGNLNGSEYSDEDGKKFAVAYFREELKATGLQPRYLCSTIRQQGQPTQNKTC